MDKLFNILEQSPLLDTKSAIFNRLFYEENFQNEKMEHRSLYNNNKLGGHKSQNPCLDKYKQCKHPPYYFKFWLSGFLEGAANFSVYNKNDFWVAFSTREYTLINHIKGFFQSNNKIITKNNKNQTVLYQLILTNTSINNVLIHLKENPLLGHKKAVYNKFYSHFNKIAKKEKVSVPSLEPNKDAILLLQKRHLYIEPFFVGLLEGDGSVYLGRTKGGNKSYGCFQIKLKYYPENHAMLELIRHNIGGTIHYEKRTKGNDQIAWVATAQKDVKKILNIFEKYPLLTSRKICQLEYLKQCMQNRCWNFHLQTRDSKYLNQQKLIDYYKDHFNIPSYFGPWLSGFSEAEGHFGSSTGLIFCIGQNDDWYILNAIKKYFGSRHKLVINKDLRPNRSQYQYKVVMTGEPTIERILTHFENHPLLGYKTVSYDLLCSKFYKNK
jgi:hypothetical protein